MGSAVERLLGEHLQRRADHHVRIWMLMNLDVWYRIYLSGERTASLDQPDRVSARVPS